MKSSHIDRRQFLHLSAAWLAGALLAACRVASTATPQAALGSGLPTSDPFSTVNILAEGLDFPESPAFDAQGALWCTEIGAGNLVRWTLEGLTRIPTAGRPNSLVFDPQGFAWVCDSGQNAIRRFDPASERWETLAESVDGQRLQTPNDLCFDRQGNLIFTCPNYASETATGYICCLSTDGVVRKIGQGFYRPNGLELVADGSELVVGDTFQKALYKGTWDSKSIAWNQVTRWAEVGGREGPDGMTLGQDGFLYVAIYGDGVIRLVDLQGKVAQELSLPGRNPTNAAFDPAGKLGLVVTEAEKGLLLSLPQVQPRAVTRWRP